MRTYLTWWRSEDIVRTRSDHEDGQEKNYGHVKNTTISSGLSDEMIVSRLRIEAVKDQQLVVIRKLGHFK